MLTFTKMTYEIKDSNGRTSNCSLQEFAFIKNGWTFTNIQGLLKKKGLLADFNKLEKGEPRITDTCLRCQLDNKTETCHCKK